LDEDLTAPRDEFETAEEYKVSVKITVDYSYDGKRYSKEFLDTIRLYNRNVRSS